MKRGVQEKGGSGPPDPPPSGHAYGKFDNRLSLLIIFANKQTISFKKYNSLINIK